MKKVLNYILPIVKILLFWIIIFDVMRVLFIAHNAGKVNAVGWLEIAKSFLYSFRLDTTAAAMLSIVPFLLFTLWKVLPFRLTKILLVSVFTVEVLAVLFIHAGEINAYPEWNHKLSSRVFMHLANPDEVGRTASGSMVFWFLLYTTIGAVFAFFLSKTFLKQHLLEIPKFNWKTKSFSFLSFVLITPFLILLSRGGLQPIPINIDAAYYSKSSIANDLSVN